MFSWKRFLTSCTPVEMVAIQGVYLHDLGLVIVRRDGQVDCQGEKVLAEEHLELGLHVLLR